MKMLRALVFGFATTALCACPRSGASVTARATAVTTSLESVLYAVVTVDFRNAGAADCKVAKYVVTWPSGKKTITPSDGLVVPARGTAQRRARIDEMSDRTRVKDVTITATCA